MTAIHTAGVSNAAFGAQLRAWRTRRRLSQLALAAESGTEK